MQVSEITEALGEMETVRIESGREGQTLLLDNGLPGFRLELFPEKITDLQWVFSPYGEACVQFFLTDGGFLIVSPNDFVFDVQQTGFIQVENLPPVCSVRELMMGFEDYRHYPMPSPNYDENLGLFYLHHYIFQSADARGITVPFMDELIRIGKENGIWMEG
jgi:hypothetical protein